MSVLLHEDVVEVEAEDFEVEEDVEEDVAVGQ